MSLWRTFTLIRYQAYLPGLLGIIGVTAVLLTACSQEPAEQPTSPGASLFQNLECIHCHQMNGEGPGPSLVGLYGQTIPLETGEPITADAQYIRTSILEPRAHTHVGYPPIMPSYAGRIDEAELELLVEYIQSLEEGS